MVKIFDQINDANIRFGWNFGVESMASFLNNLRSGELFNRSPQEQVESIGSVCEAYLGRGELIWGLIDGGFLPSGFADGMQIAVWRYFLTLDISEDQKDIFREYLTQRLGK